MNILVTGGAGFIGSNFIHHVLSLADSDVALLINLDKLTYAGNPENLTNLDNEERYRFVHGDIKDRKLVDHLLEKHRIDAVINFAAESHVDRSIDSPEPFFNTNVIGTLRLLDSVRAYYSVLENKRAQRFRFLHVSTDEVYGSLGPDDPAFCESNPYEPNSPYSASKAASDHIVRAYHHTYGLPVLTTNCSNNYGPYQFPEKLIPLMILNALDSKPLPIYGDGLQVRDWLYVEDHCSAIMEVLNKGIPGETYNIGGNAEMANIVVVDTICEILDNLRTRDDGNSYKTLKTYVKDRPGHDRRYAMNIEKIGRELGWSPRVDFKEGLRKTVQWYLDNLAWCRNITETRYRRERLGNVGSS